MITANKKALCVAFTALLLSACKDSSSNNTDASKSDEHQTEGFEVSEAGRLVVTSADSAELGIFNSKDGVLVERIALNNPASGLYASPQFRFALVPQRDQNQVQIIDGGLYQEDHGDHLHPYEKAPELIDLVFNDTRPTHYRDHEVRSAFFFDGDSDNGLLSSIISFDDDEILNNKTRALGLDNFMHGTAEPRGDFLITTYRAANAESTLPDQVELHSFNATNDRYEFVERFEERCPALHGSFSTEEASVFGCSDGVLVIRQNGDSFNAEKIANPEGFAEGLRIGGFSGYADSHVIAGWARGDLYAVNLDDNSITLIDWNGDKETGYSTAKMDDEGEVLMVLDTDGGLHLLDSTNNFQRLKEIQVFDEMPVLEGHASISIIASKASENVYIADAANKQLIVVNIEHQEVEDPISLPFTPKHVAWVGIPGEEHEHEHDH